ncbi:MAG TPA: hypothetical protein PLA83_13390, partial [Deltaproteobacteria bacterium]|nr:hypothetical protein [Deltaproteobacteria bacterium]
MRILSATEYTPLKPVCKTVMTFQTLRGSALPVMIRYCVDDEKRIFALSKIDAVLDDEMYACIPGRLREISREGVAPVAPQE